MTYLQDERRLHDIAVGEHPELPYFIFGHSWGSMLARGYAANFGEDITGLMLCGICAQMEGCIIEFRKKDLAGVLRRNRRNFHYPSFSPATSVSRSINSLLLWKV